MYLVLIVKMPVDVKALILDFDRVHSVGQGCADEVFRVWHKRFPNIKLTAINMSEEVTFMIERARAFQFSI
ncbi:MAG: STAS-like domain-containing protein [Myxococcales bacterium]|nr:MAG: STAS-like domain-containing protein [Myxococcales bacterium]